MKKYILTETQLKSVIDVVMNEAFNGSSNNQILRFADLARFVAASDSHPEQYEMVYDALLNAFIDVYRDEGDEGVVKFFTQGTKIPIEALGHGRYILKY